MQFNFDDWNLSRLFTKDKIICTLQRTNSISSARLISESCSEAFGDWWLVKNNSYNKNQQDALFLTFILVKNSTCLGLTYCPSSGALILYSEQLVFVILVMLMSASEVGMELVGLLAFIIAIYHGARSSECQIVKNNVVNNTVWENE
jgi:hypothetical protein